MCKATGQDRHPTKVKLLIIINFCQIGHLLYVITHFMEKFLKVFTIYGPGGHFDHVLDDLYKLSFSLLMETPCWALIGKVVFENTIFGN